MKNRFSEVAQNYSQFRPGYPDTLFADVTSHCRSNNEAWDTGTGNGQAASHLSKYFNKVYASDISQEQLAHAIPASNISYYVSPAENSQLPAGSIDLIFAAQAAHWFDLRLFYDEVTRVASKGAIICLAGYGVPVFHNFIDPILHTFYFHKIYEYWDDERRHIENNYQSLNFPFEEIQLPPYNFKLKWALEDLLGYLRTWSAVRNFIRHNDIDPVENLLFELQKSGDTVGTFIADFKIFTRCGRLNF
ncbi:MAG: class I SAM-dependent methyltransferase [Saprospiraceae bacterium]|nr:class I SAM-dependent methyltransferase [Saprospiraceae bacterium]HMW38724.1 class I SAM-dependent methyltransferase [Saprospiraceae bacterium]HMX88618.1 class I SAM-dependent methyltransferase [Saprospiraceae bacterium]HMZ40198.1 class I SAM-dependent methyltransferase [Saprospiraceae bacterium]HNA63620.1 class I SAM-dependent methyltransferase [Saprospiraceae bacterium]